MSILSALKTQTNSIDDLAALPQAMIMQMAQKGQIREDMLAPILSRKAEMAEAVARTRALQGAGQQPTVMEQIMQKNAQAEAPEAREMGVAQLPVRGDMYQGMAGGGIVAFVDGGDVEDDDENEAYQEALEDAEMEDMMDRMILSKGVGLGGLKPSTRSSSSVGIGAEKRPEPGNVTSVIQTAANKYNLPTELMERIAVSESGGRSDAANKLSSAKGLFQFTDATWKGMGGKEGEQFDAERNADLGGKFIRQNAEGLKNSLGRNPTYAEVYAAHYFGLDGAKQLMNMDPDLPMSKAVSERVMKANPNLKGKTVGQVMASLEKKTGRGIVELAEGGEVRHFYGGDYVGFGEEAPYDPNEPSLYSRFGDIFGSPLERLGSSIKGVGFTTERERKENIAKREKDKTLKQTQEREPTLYDQTTEAEDASFAAPAQPAPPASPVAPETPKDAYTRALERFEARQARLAASEGEDKNLALMAAGLGMMGGTSPYALANIGAGGMKGLEHYAAAKRGRASEELANEKALASLLKTKEYADIRGANAKALEESRLRDDLLAARKQVEANVMSRYKGDPSLWDPKTKAKVTQEIQQALVQDEYYNLIAKKLGISSGPSTPTPIGSYSLKSGLSVNK